MCVKAVSLPYVMVATSLLRIVNSVVRKHMVVRWYGVMHVRVIWKASIWRRTVRNTAPKMGVLWLSLATARKCWRRSDTHEC